MFLDARTLGQFTPTRSNGTYGGTYGSKPDPYGLQPGEPTAPEPGQAYSVGYQRYFRGNSGKIYLLYGQFWVQCPQWPSVPNMSGDLASVIQNVRQYYDYARTIMFYLYSQGGTDFYLKIKNTCPNMPKELLGSYSEGLIITRTISARLGAAANYSKFHDYLYQRAFPDIRMLTSVGPDWMIHGSGTYTPPSRPSAQEVSREAQNLSTIVQAWDNIPWPHDFMKNFLLWPLVNLPVFGGGYTLNNPEIARSGYFPKTVAQIQRDIAQYVADNENLFNEHFLKEVERWIRRQEEKAEQQQKKIERIGKIFGVIGIVMDLLVPGVGSLIMSAISAPITISQVKKLTEDQVKAAKKFQELFGITDSAIETFRLWIISKIDQKPVETPPTPPPQENEPSHAYRFSFFVEDQLVLKADDYSEGLKKVFEMTQTGHRILIKNEASGETVDYFIRMADGLKRVPSGTAGKLQALPASSAQKIAGKGEFPWIMLVPIALKVL